MLRLSGAYVDSGMPRRTKPDPLALAVGRRIRHIRAERGLTAEKLAFESELGSKGFLSDIEHGLASPSLQTLAVIADHLGVAILDLLTFPDDGDRELLVDRTRVMSKGTIRRLLRDTSLPESERSGYEAPPARSTRGADSQSPGRAKGRSTTGKKET